MSAPGACAAAAAAGGDGGGGAPPGAGAGGGAPLGAGAGGGAPGAGAGGANNNTNGGNSASQSSGGPFSGYILLLFLFPLLALYCYIHVPVPDIHDASSMLLHYCYVLVPDIHDAHDVFSMLLVMLHVVTRSPYTAYAMIIVLTFWIKICRFMTIFPTIQKPDRSFSVVGSAAALKSYAFDGSNYKKWKARALLWLTAMQCFYVSRGKRSEPPLSPEEEAKFETLDCLFRGALISVLADNIVDVYMQKDMWDALEAKFGVSDAGSELYVVEQFYDYKMVDDRSLVEQAHEIQMLAKELKNNNCELPDKFVAGGIIAKLPPSWSDFATSLKHKRQEFSVSDLIGSLGVQEKARAKRLREVLVPIWYRRRTLMHPTTTRKSSLMSNPRLQPTLRRKARERQRETALCVASLGIRPRTVLSTKTGSLPTWSLARAEEHRGTVGRGSSLLIGNGSLAAVHGVGTVDLKFTSGKTVQLKNVQHVPSIKKNLVSGSLLCREGFRLVFKSNKCVVSKYETFVGKGYDSGGLFRFSLNDMCNNHNVVNHISENDESNVWHSRLCHVNFSCMTRLANMSLIPKFTLVKGSKCHTCVQSKQHRKPHKASEARNLAPLELVHSDLCEMNSVLTKGEKKYFMTLIDDCTRFCYVYLLKTKDEALHYFKIYKAEVDNQLERKIKRLRSDRGGEYFSNEFASFCEEFGIIHERTPPYSPQSNGVAERKNRTLTEMVNAMLDTAGLSKEWWGEAVLTACHVLNKIPMKHKEVTPFEEWERKKLNLSYLRTWGCLAKVNVPIAKKQKLGPNTVDCVFLGYAIHSVGYRFLIVNSGVPDMHVGTVFESRDATFFENEFPMKHTPSTSSQETVMPHEHFAPIEHNDQTPEENPEEDNIVDTRKSKRQRVAKSFGDDYIVYLVDNTPRTIEEAYSSPDADYWKEAVRSEMDSIMSNGTWEVVERPYGCKPVGCKWVFKKSLGLMMDVKTAFLNGELEEEIYMDQLDGYVLEGGGEGVILCLYVDDILIFGTNLNVIEEVKDYLSKSFEMKDLGEADVILNIKLQRGDEGGITLVQSHYVDKVLSRFGYSDCKPAPTPYDPSVLLRKNRRIARDQLRYSQIIGSLMYLASATRPDISFAVSKLSRFVSNPGDDHWQALERVMRYLKGTMSYGIHYTGYPKVLERYSDSNWISDADEIKATSGYVFTLGGGAVSWKSCKQTILTRSTMEAELTALDTATVEAKWLRELLMDLPVVEKPVPAILMNCDNQIVIIKVNSLKDNMKSSRHIKRRLKYVRKQKNSGVIALDYVQTARNLADQFTKGLPRIMIDSASREMGLIPT
uniref:Gag/pol polyprotein n=2 Tax=Oryza sativa subsp. japonica TaxID=39947 RepID=Q10EA1_ORYSJ|nr:putative gag/pol polyprotein [Oryza sativa Japonica Group]ABF98438.1 retrotransposon protein, putative, Ty1-copia subclass [Oryza sativa Japonica Group]